MSEYTPVAFLVGLLGSLVIGSACAENEYPRRYGWTYDAVPTEVRDARAQWLLKCTEAGNPYSDEEGEDLVAECADQAEELYPPLPPMPRWLVAPRDEVDCRNPPEDLPDAAARDLCRRYRRRNGLDRTQPPTTTPQAVRAALGRTQETNHASQ